MSLNMSQLLDKYGSSIEFLLPRSPSGTDGGGLTQPLLALVLGGEHDGVALRVLAAAEGVRVVVLNVQLLGCENFIYIYLKP